MASTAQALASLLDFLEAHGLVERTEIRARAASDRSEPCEVDPVAVRLADLEARACEAEARLDALDGGVED